MKLTLPNPMSRWLKGALLLIVAGAAYWAVFSWKTAQAEESVSEPVEVTAQVDPGEIPDVPILPVDEAPPPDMGWFDRLTSVRPFITSGDASSLAEHVDTSLELRFEELEARETYVTEREEVATAREHSNAEAAARLEAVRVCVLSSMEVTSGLD